MLKNILYLIFVTILLWIYLVVKNMNYFCVTDLRLNEIEIKGNLNNCFCTLLTVSEEDKCYSSMNVVVMDCDCPNSLDDCVYSNRIYVRKDCEYVTIFGEVKCMKPGTHVFLDKFHDDIFTIKKTNLD